MHKQRIFLTGILLFVFLAQSVDAAPVHTVSGSLGGCGLGTGAFMETGEHGVNLTQGTGDTGCSMSVTGVAEGGRVGVQANVSIIPEFNGAADGRINASALYDDFVFKLPASYTGGAINVNVNTSFDAQIGAIVDVLALTSQARLNARLMVSGNPGGFNAFTRIVNSPEYNVTAGSTSGLSNGETVDQTLSSGFVSINPTLPFSVKLEIFGISFINASGGSGFAASTIDALNTFSFATSGAVFDLPDGFSVSSVSANIVDNSWVAPVPLPAGLGLMLSALGTLLLRKRWSH